MGLFVVVDTMNETQLSLDVVRKRKVRARENIPFCISFLSLVFFASLLPSFFLFSNFGWLCTRDTSPLSRGDLRVFCIQHKRPSRSKTVTCANIKPGTPGPTQLNHFTRVTRTDSKTSHLSLLLLPFWNHFNTTMVLHFLYFINWQRKRYICGGFLLTTSYVAISFFHIKYRVSSENLEKLYYCLIHDEKYYQMRYICDN
jgi:hypothetical protein